MKSKQIRAGRINPGSLYTGGIEVELFFEVIGMKIAFWLRVFLAGAFLSFTSCTTSDTGSESVVLRPEQPPAAVVESITTEDLMAHISKLASAKF